MTITEKKLLCCGGDSHMIEMTSHTGVSCVQTFLIRWPRHLTYFYLFIHFKLNWRKGLFSNVFLTQENLAPPSAWMSTP